MNKEAGQGKSVKPDRRRETGQYGEEAACGYLQQKGYRIIERNWRCRSGEIDIVAEEDGRLVVVEVRTRRSARRFGTAAESVNYRKQKQVADTAQFYLRTRGFGDVSVRFDVITVELDGAFVREINHIEAAF
ncbi:YraN family protein [Paenibacillus protaetiae]|uniref:YraN family protein n=1 Tax=Paenibacillus protaetiae TaxID=2509456 RepID=UPI001FC94FE9|nr:YraN family protein [Paenibacillus protaetiae]